MSVYIKGAIAAVIVIAGILAWYFSKEAELPVNVAPAEFKMIDKMEKEGMPEWSLPKLDGQMVKNTDLKGKIVILNFWASWCNPCVEEFPSMLKLVEHFKGEVVVLAVSTDDEQKDIETFTKAFGLPKPNFEVLWDKDKKIRDMHMVEKIPESFLVNKDGKLIRKVLGVENWASKEALSYFQDLVEGKDPNRPHN